MTTEIKQFYFFDQSYNNNTKSFEWLDVSNCAFLCFTVFCSSNCQLVVSYSISSDYFVIDTDVYNVNSSQLLNFYFKPKCKFLKIDIININVLPSDLQIQSFFSS
jgi:hypothetical protein